MDEDQSNPPGQGSIISEQSLSEADARLAARLKQIVTTPGISDKDRKLVEQNLKRLATTSPRRVD